MGAGNMSILKLQHFSASAGTKPLVKNINLTLEAGEVLALIGPNGAGKSSLLRAIVGDLPCDSGELTIVGRRTSDFEPKELARHMAYLPQASELNFPFEALDVVLMGRIPHSSGNELDREIAMQALHAMDVGHLRNSLYTHLSGGEKQRVQLARIMAQLWREQDANERLLILDEPCAALDIAHAGQLMHCIRKMANNGVAIVMVLHDLAVAARNANRVAVINHGELVKLGTPSEVINRETMNDVFQVEASIIPHPNSGYPLVYVND